jgi:TM2 domain-containing membrane protein YozV
MDCVNHNGASATAYCQSCGKALCAGCVRNAAGGQILCEPCWTAWVGFSHPFVASNPSGANPSAAAILGLIPGVGAMYNGQFFKGLIHVVIFAVLISITDHYPIFGLFIAAWILYQSFEAYHTAKARRDGQPLPDPLGLNEVGNWLNLGAKPQYPGQPGAAPAQPAPGPGVAGPAGQAPVAGGYPPPYAGPYQPPYGQSPYQTPYPPPPAGFVDPGLPPIPPVPSPEYWHPVFWRRKEPVGAVVLIALGLLFLLGQMNIFNGRLMEFAWPLLLIGLGVWLIVRRLGESQGGSK